MADNIKLKRGILLKVVELGLEPRIYEEMKKPSFSAEAITRQLNNEGIKITAQSIRKFIKQTKKAQSELISKDLRASDEYRQLTMNYSKALKDILTEVEEVKNMAKTEKDYTTYNQLIGRLMQGIELIAKLTGDISPKGAIDINIIYNEINNNMEKEMKDVKHDIFKGTTIDVDAVIKSDDEEVAKKINKTEDEDDENE